jgi:hypothetical protein
MFRNFKNMILDVALRSGCAEHFDSALTSHRARLPSDLMNFTNGAFVSRALGHSLRLTLPGARSFLQASRALQRAVSSGKRLFGVTEADRARRRPSPDRENTFWHLVGSLRK